MKLLYIGTYKEPSGWGDAARTDLLALAKSFDVVARPVVYSGGVTHPEIEKLESKSTIGVTQVFQYCLPTEYDMYGRMPHYGYCEIESSDLSYSKWPEFFNRVNMILTPNKDATLVKSNSRVKITHLPHAINTIKFKKDYPITKIKEANGTFKFLCIAEAIPRKNLEGLIESYYTTFDPTEPVSLIIKTNRNIDKIIEGVQNKVKLYPNKVFYQKIIVVSERINDAQMMGLYKYCDCYINTSMGESWCLPLVNAIGFNKPIVTTVGGGPSDLIENYPNVIPVNSVYINCHHGNGIEWYQNSRDHWFAPNMLNLSKGMRAALTMNIEENSNVLDEYSEEKFCGRLKELLNES